MNENEMKIYYQLMLDICRAIKDDLQGMQDDQRWWDQLIQRYGEIGEKYQDTITADFAVGISVLCMHEIERQWKRRKEG